MGKRKEKADYSGVLILFLSALCAAFLGLILAIDKSVDMADEKTDKLLERVWELQRIDRQKCADLLLNDKI